MERIRSALVLAAFTYAVLCLTGLTSSNAQGPPPLPPPPPFDFIHLKEFLPAKDASPLRVAPQTAVYTPNRSFLLPVMLRGLPRERPRECRLHVRCQGKWELDQANTVTGRDATSFLYTAPDDGEYTFAVTTTPPNGNSEAPESFAVLRVVVDSKPPDLDGRVGVGLLDVIAIDANLDPKSVEATVLADVPRPLVRRKDGHTFLLTAIDREHDIQIVAADRAGNVSVQFIPGRATSLTDIPKTFSKIERFHIPVQWLDGDLAKYRDYKLQLYVQRADGNWRNEQTIEIGAPSFRYQADADGDYRFGVMFRDRLGRPLSQKPETMMHVVVDRRPPQIQASVIQENGRTWLKIAASDENLDAKSVQAWVVSEAVKRPLVARPGESVFPLRDTDLIESIRVTAADLAGNVTAIELVPQDNR